MIIIIDENMGFVKPLSKYIFAQYEERFRDVGTFEIKAQMEDENLFLLDREKKYYVLFDFKVFGKITDISKDSDSEYDKIIEIKGSLSPYLFTKRVIRGTLNFTGQTYKYVETLVKTYITNVATTDPRYMNISIVFDNEERLKQVCSTIERQVTGGYLWDEMSEYLEKDRLGIEFYPIMGTIQANGANITSWVLKISSGRDCTIGNTQQNEAILLSQTWNSINKTSYEINLKKQSDVAYLAGEGEGADRKWYEVSRDDTVKQNTGFNRNELWVDARDVQSTKEDGSTLTDEEYQQKITERANEKLEENNISEVYESTMNKVDKRYTYGENIFLGDIVTVIDAELNNIQLEAQIVGAITSYEGATKTVDLSLAYGAIEDNRTINDRLEQTKINVEAVNTAVSYLQNAIRILAAVNIGFDSSETVIKATDVQTMLQLVDKAVNGLSESISDISWNDIAGKPSSFPPSSHNHDGRYYTETEVNNLLVQKARMFQTAWGKSLSIPNVPHGFVIYSQNAVYFIWGAGVAGSYEVSAKLIYGSGSLSFSINKKSGTVTVSATHTGTITYVGK